jgi:hypothetical protein
MPSFALANNRDTIPAALCERTQWVLWRSMPAKTAQTADRPSDGPRGFGQRPSDMAVV